jgi:hypothetical protein
LKLEIDQEEGDTADIDDGNAEGVRILKNNREYEHFVRNYHQVAPTLVLHAYKGSAKMASFVQKYRELAENSQENLLFGYFPRVKVPGAADNAYLEVYQEGRRQTVYENPVVENLPMIVEYYQPEG